jgi:hypothetical protein
MHCPLYSYIPLLQFQVRDRLLTYLYISATAFIVFFRCDHLTTPRRKNIERPFDVIIITISIISNASFVSLYIANF